MAQVDEVVSCLRRNTSAQTWDSLFQSGARRNIIAPNSGFGRSRRGRTLAIVRDRE